VTAIAKNAAVALAVALAAQAHADSEPIGFPEAYAAGVHYATVNRGNIREEIFTSRAAIDAAKAGQPMPPGTVITLLDYRDGVLFRYVAMEKRPERWAFQWFNPDRSVKRDESTGRCVNCHTSRAADDFVWTLDRMKIAR
jgi:hypothetical protein